ncbi:MmcQ/YjbR family DNA-binding protein [Soonwooa sp.]|uniref:MmcQ/YjbR family DNA-binding protein n=1 Tax=Soonwooa sp. TaxID=1938592 RepID=UPI0028B15562|nr:MmcQ/YjbR family DNA-binding protein [Soonwooa sp.]
MNSEEIRDYCLLKKGVEESFPFDKETLVFKVGNKMFALMSLERQPTSLNLKADPDWSLKLREEYWQIVPGYHMNKVHWNTVNVDGLKPNLIKELIDHSYDLIFASLTKKVREEILL